MSMNTRLPDEHQTQSTTPERIAELLTLATEQLDSDTLEALLRSRQTALARQTIHVRSASLSSGHGIHWLISHSVRHWAAILLVTAVVFGAGYWQHLRKHERMTNLDVAILTDDMPMDVFIDH